MPKVKPSTQQVTKQRVRDYIVAGALALVMVWLVFLNVSIFRKERIAEAAAHDSQKELSSLQSRSQSLEANVNELATERGQEGTLRETFGVAKPGEGEIIVVPQKVASSTPPVSFWHKWFGWAKFW
jgi:cell division protein FtsB